MQRDRMLLLVMVVGVVLAAAVAALVSPPLAAVPLALTAVAVVVLRRSSEREDEWYDDEAEDDGYVASAGDEDGDADGHQGPVDTFTTWQPEGGLSTWQPPAGTEAYVDEAANEYAAESWDAATGFDADSFGDQQAYEPLPTWGTFVVGEVIEEVSSSDDILVASQQSALSVTEDLSEEDVQRVNQELLSRVHSLLAKYD